MTRFAISRSNIGLEEIDYYHSLNLLFVRSRTFARILDVRLHLIELLLTNFQTIFDFSELTRHLSIPFPRLFGDLVLSVSLLPHLRLVRFHFEHRDRSPFQVGHHEFDSTFAVPDELGQSTLERLFLPPYPFLIRWIAISAVFVTSGQRRILPVFSIPSRRTSGMKI